MTLFDFVSQLIGNVPNTEATICVITICGVIACVIISHLLDFFQSLFFNLLGSWRKKK